MITLLYDIYFISVKEVAKFRWNSDLLFSLLLNFFLVGLRPLNEWMGVLNSSDPLNLVKNMHHIFFIPFSLSDNIGPY